MSLGTHAQLLIKGRVLDEQGGSLPGANVYWKGSQTGTVANATGYFELAASAHTDTLLVRFIGYYLVELPIMPTTTMPITIRMQPKATLVGAGLGVDIVGQRLHDNFTAMQATKLAAEQLAMAGAGTTADVLQQTGQVFLQKSQQGGGSPVLRGMEANRLLLMLDGMRLNNAIFRSGHLQQAITIDQYLLEGVDVFFGANSLSYGSDAMGGAVNFKTKMPKWKEGAQAAAVSKVASAAREATVHADASYGKGNWGALTSLTYSHFGDAQSGKRPNPFYAYFWKRDSLVQRIGGIDRVVANPDPYRQSPTGYWQLNAAQKLVFAPAKSTEHQLAVLYTTSSDIPRYDRLTQNGQGFFVNTDFRQASWAYGPQQRWSAAYTLERAARSKEAFWQLLRYRAFYQSMAESRMSRRFGQTMLRTQKEAVSTWGTRIDLLSKPAAIKWQAGAEAYRDQVTSKAYETAIETAMREPAATRYPDGGSKMHQIGLYAVAIRTWQGGQATAGLRYTRTSLQANFVDTAFFQFPFKAISQHHQALTGSINLKQELGKGWEASALLSSAFRAPNVDDAAKVFDSRAGETIIVPNSGIAAEYAYNAEVGVGRKGTTWVCNLNAYYTWLQDLIQVGDYRFNGQDSLLIEGVQTKVQANVNVGSARIWGWHAHVGWMPAPAWELGASATFTRGQAGNGLPLGHIPPFYMQWEAAHEWRALRLKQRFFLQYNAWKRWKQLSPNDVDRPTLAVQGEGFPAWATLNYRVQWQAGKQWQLQLGIDNLLNTHYRAFASGVNGLGRNVSLMLRWRTTGA